MLRLLFYIFFVHFSLIISAQNPCSWLLSTKNGFPCNEVYDIHEASNGVIWFATNNGLYSFNGVDYQLYSSSYQTGTAKFNIQETKSGNIWCSNLSGQVFEVSSDSLLLFKEFEVTDYIEFGYLILDNTVIVNSPNGVLTINLESSKEQVAIGNDASRQWTNTPTLLNGRVFCLSDNWSVFELVHQRLEKVVDVPGSKNQDNRLVVVNNELYCIQNGQDVCAIYKIQINSHSVKEIDISENLKRTRIYDFSFDGDSLLWVSTPNGAFAFSTDFKPLNNGESFFSHTSISRVIKDGEGNTWMTSPLNGGLVVPNLEMKIHKRFKEANFTSICKASESDVFIGTHLGDVYLWNHELDSVIWKRTFRNEPVQQLQYTPSKRFLNISQSVGTQFDYKTQQVMRTDFYSSWKGVEYHEKSDSWVLANYNGAILQSFNGGRADAIKLKEGHSRCILNDSVNDRVIIGFYDGLFVYEEAKLEELKLTDQLVVVNDLTLYKNEVWCVTADGKIIKELNGELTEVSIQYSNQSPFEHIVSDENSIWLLNEKSVYKYDPSRKDLIRIDQNDGLPLVDYRGIELTNDKVLIITDEGVVTFPKIGKYSNEIAPLVSIDSVNVNDRGCSVLTELEHRENNLVFHFSGINFSNRSGMEYQYRLNGLTDWVTTKSPVARFPSVPPGKYQFQLRGINQDGVKSDTLSIQVLIGLPYWKTWWFIWSMILLGAIGVLFLIKVVVNRSKRRQQQAIEQERIKNELVQSRLVALRAQLNPHFMFNALNSIQEYILTNQKILASEYLGKFADLMRTYLEFSKRETILLNEEIQTLEAYLELEAIRFEDLDYQVEVSDQLDLYLIEVPPLFIQPYVENAFKHGLLHKQGKKKLCVSFSLSPERHLKVVITDNGVGRVAAGKLRKIKHQSFAANASQSRLDLLNQTSNKGASVEIIDLKEGETPQGTQVNLLLPITEN